MPGSEMHKAGCQFQKLKTNLLFTFSTPYTELLCCILALLIPILLSVDYSHAVSNLVLGPAVVA